ncbi:MAG: hypothetical protein V1749_03015 [Candidatus Desantisbacteria bacterium]
MFEDEILQQFLVKSVEDAKKQIKDSGILSVESVLPLLLHSQYNHILHLEAKMATKDDISRLENEITRMDGNMKQMDGNMKQIEGTVKHLDGNIKHLQWVIMYGFAIVAIIVPISTTIIIAAFTK